MSPHSTLLYWTSLDFIYLFLIWTSILFLQKPTFVLHVGRWWTWWQTSTPGLAWSRNTPFWVQMDTRLAGRLTVSLDHKVSSWFRVQPRCKHVSCRHPEAAFGCFFKYLQVLTTAVWELTKLMGETSWSPIIELVCMPESRFVAQMQKWCLHRWW